MSNLIPNTTSAAAKLLRTLTSTLHTRSPTPVPSETFSSATTASSEPLLTTLASLLTPATPLPSINNALQILFNLSNTLPPSHLAPHWRTFCQKVLKLSKQVQNPRTLIALSSLLIASIPLSTLGTEQRAVVAAIAQQSLQHVQTTLSTYPAESLCVIHATIHAAPRELRAQILDERLHALFANPEPNVRSLAAIVSAGLVTCVTEKQQQALFSKRVAYVQEQVADIIALLDAFTTGRYKGNMADKTSKNICDHLDGVCKLLIHLLDLPIRVAFPLGIVLNTLCDGVRERSIDPYAVVEGVEVTHDELLIIIPHVQRLCEQTIADLTERVHKGALQMLVKNVGEIFEMRLSKLLLRSRVDNSLTCIVERGNMYATIGRLVTSLGTGLLDFVVPRFQELFEIDVALHKKHFAGKKALTVNPVSNIQSGGKSRKRRRHNGQRDASVGSSILAKESVQGLASVYGKETSRIVVNTMNIALNVIVQIFDCRGLLTKAVVKHLHKLEDILLEILEEKRLSTVLLRAVATAAFSGGSKRMACETSPLLMPLARMSVMAALDTSLSSETRYAALTARAGCEAIIHPRGPPYVKESRMYPTIVGNGRSGTEKRAAKKDVSSLSEKPTSEQNGSLPSQGDAIDTRAKDTVEEQKTIQAREAGEKSGKKAIDETPSNDLMEVDDTVEVQPTLTKTKEELPEKAKSKGDEIIDIAPTKETEIAKQQVDRGIRDSAEQLHPSPVVDKARVGECRTEPLVRNEPEQPLEVGADSEKEYPKHHSGDSGGTEHEELAKRDEGQDERDNNTPHAHERADSAELDSKDEEDEEKEDQALIDGLVFESSDEE